VTSPVRWHALCCNGFASVFQILASVELVNPLQHSAWRSCIVNACVPSARFEKLAAFEMTFLKCSCVRVGQGPGTGLFASGAALRCRSDWESAVFWRFDGLAMRRFAEPCAREAALVTTGVGKRTVWPDVEWRCCFGRGILE